MRTINVITSAVVMTLALVQEVSCGWEWGPCPKTPVMQNFNLNSYTGMWYEQVRDKSVWYETGDCVQARYTRQADGSVEVRNSQRKPGQNFIKPARSAKAKCSETKGQCYVSFFYFDKADYAILDSDFTNWAVVKNCQTYFLGLFRQEVVWILTRDPDGDTTAAFAAISAKYPGYDTGKNLQTTF